MGKRWGAREEEERERCRDVEAMEREDEKVGRDRRTFLSSSNREIRMRLQNLHKELPSSQPSTQPNLPTSNQPNLLDSSNKIHLLNPLLPNTPPLHKPHILHQFPHPHLRVLLPLLRKSQDEFVLGGDDLDLTLGVDVSMSGSGGGERDVDREGERSGLEHGWKDWFELGLGLALSGWRVVGEEKEGRREREREEEGGMKQSRRERTVLVPPCGSTLFTLASFCCFGRLRRVRPPESSQRSCLKQEAEERERSR